MIEDADLLVPPEGPAVVLVLRPLPQGKTEVRFQPASRRLDVIVNGAALAQVRELDEDEWTAICLVKHAKVVHGLAVSEGSVRDVPVVSH